MSRLLHYSAEPLGPLRRIEQRAGTAFPHDKPRGLWVSVEGPDDWREWCEAEGFGLDRLAHAHEVTLRPGARVLWLRGASDIDGFTARYGAPYGIGHGFHMTGIRWADVAADHQGIVIAPYCWERRLHHGADWYYGWDCASGCIWDPEAIEAVALLEKAA